MALAILPTESEGLILDVMPDRGFVGLEEGREFLWLRLRGTPVEVYGGLHNSLYRIPFSRLEWARKLAPVDWSRVRNRNDLYQPFLGVMQEQPETGRYDSNGLVLDAWGLIWDVMGERWL